MKWLHKEKLQQFRRAHELLTGGTPDPTLAVPLQGLGDAMTRLDALAGTERAVERTARAQTVRVRALAHSLEVDHLRRISIAAETAYPGGSTELQSLRALARVPRGPTHITLIHAARGVAQAIELDVDRFVAAGLPKDFRTQLLDAASALERAMQGRAELAQERRAATEGVREQVRRGSLHLRLLKSLVRSSLQGDPERRARWEQAIRLPRSASSKPADGEGEQTATPPVPPAKEVKAAA